MFSFFVRSNDVKIVIKHVVLIRPGWYILVVRHALTEVNPQVLYGFELNMIGAKSETGGTVTNSCLHELSLPCLLEVQEAGDFAWNSVIIFIHLSMCLTAVAYMNEWMQTHTTQWEHQMVKFGFIFDMTSLLDALRHSPQFFVSFLSTLFSCGFNISCNKVSSA